MVNWKSYKKEKPKEAGVYLIKNDESNPPLRWASYYHPYHGWTNVGHILEKVIEHWSPWPEAK
jgi:hypothetical protein